MLRPKSSQVGQLLAKAFLRPSLSTRMFILRQLANMLHAGVPLGQAIGNIRRRTRNRLMRKMLLDAEQVVTSGGLLSDGLSRHTSAFGPLEMALIKSGELIGRLDMSANQAADYLQKEIEIRRNFSCATFYHKVLLVAFVLIPALSVLVLDGPAAYLRTVIGESLPLVLGVGIPWAILRIALQLDPVALVWDACKLRIPGIGGNVRKFALAKFSRATAALYAAGLSPAECIETAAAASGNRYIGSRIAATAGAVRHGQDIHTALCRSGVFTPLVEDMISTGQTTGDMDEMLNKVGEYYEAEAEAGMLRLALYTEVAPFLLALLYVGIHAWLPSTSR